MATDQPARQRADALLSLATAQKSTADLRAHALAVAEAALPGAHAHFHPVPDDLDDLLSGELLVRADDGRPLGLLEISRREPLDEQDLGFVTRLAELLGGCLTRLAREEELARSERRLIEAQRISQVGSYDFEIATNTNVWSDQLYRIYGREPQSFNASYERFMEMLHPDDREHVMAVHQHSLTTLEPYEMEERVVWPDGQVRTLASWGEVVADSHGTPLRMVGICWDITERRAMEEQLVREGLHDRLTDLPNRALFVDRLAQAVDSLPRRNGPLAVLFLDLDRFKVINDSLGHDVGDEVLQELARRLTATVRPGDTVARFGGDEFVVLCEGLDHPAEAVTLVRRLQEEISRPIVAQGSELVITMSAGIALGTTPDDLPTALLRDADAAMFRAKQEGRARSVVFAEGMRKEALERLDTELELRRALVANDLRLHYQPMIDLSTGGLVGVEALVRWQHPTRGLILPADFIPIAEETGLIVPLGEWVLEQACTQLAEWHREGAGRAPLTMAVNLSGLQISDPRFHDRLQGILERTGVHRPSLALEITESVLMEDAAETLDILRSLKELGIRLSIDDFGTGYSSLSYLKRFPVDELKIDRSFVDGLGDDPDDLAIVQAILALARALGMSTVAEGVETAVQLDALRGLGCTTAQGFWFSRPRPVEEMTLLRGAWAGVPSARRPGDDRQPV